MARGLDMLGAVSTGLASQYIVLHIEKIDGEILKKKLAEDKQSSAIAPLAMFAIDSAPKFLIDTALPIVEKELVKYGVTATVVAQDVPPEKGGRKQSEFLPGAVVGILVAALLGGIGWTLFKTTKLVIG